MPALEYSTQARSFFLCTFDRTAAPEDQLCQIHDLFGSAEKIREAARQYCERENDLLIDQGCSEDDFIDADAFASALKEEINEICEDLLRSAE